MSETGCTETPASPNVWDKIVNAVCNFSINQSPEATNKCLRPAIILLSCCLFMPDQMVAIASKHLSIALGIPGDKTRIYLTKFYSAKNLTNLLGSLIIIGMQSFILPAQSKVIVIVALCILMTIIRFASLMVFWLSNNVAVHFYYIMVFGSCIQGMVLSSFYPLAADYMTLLSISFKVSKFILWIVQFFLDITVSNHPSRMISIQLITCFFFTLIALLYWVFYFYQTIKCQLEAATTKQEKSTEQNTNQCATVTVQTEPTTSNQTSQSTNQEPSFTELIQRVISPMLLCILGWSMRGFFVPGIIPYTFVERDLAHPINFIIFPFAMAATMLVYCNKKGYIPCPKGISEPWNLHWHLGLWSLIGVSCITTLVVYAALHNVTGGLFALFHNNVVSVTILASQYVFFLTVAESAGYEGVSANVKYKRSNEGGYIRGERGLLIIPVNTLLSQFCVTIAYRISSGYILTRSKVYNNSSVPITVHMDAWSAFWYWISSTFSLGYKDFVHELKGDIADVIRPDNNE
ncbi:hypothetical protein BdWA1_001731 [Babesia duncani]|uniref:Uncharacterized protein n=1 Tax=Babesia duncani TaxID=323732 RepID=A0AAD9PKF3_9APIC|nr:hypothetical protein BdWA1_001731 [Babesia duncani]